MLNITRVREKKRLKEKMKKREMTKILWKHKSQYISLKGFSFPFKIYKNIDHLNERSIINKTKDLTSLRG